MDVTPLISRNQQVIQAYAGGFFKISSEIYKTPVFVRPDETVPWDIQSDVFSELSIGDFSPFIVHKDDLDVVLLGTGKMMAFIPPFLRAELKDAGLCVDCMDTGAACRTYNVLMAEGRRVACALFLHR